MIRLLLFIALLIAASIATAWFIENDGSIVVEWMGYRIQTSVGFAALTGVIILAICTLVLESILWVRSLPERYQRKRREKQRERGISALTEGFAAIAAGDAKNARRLSSKAESCLGSLPVTRLLSAQTSQLEGNKEQAKQQYSVMLEHKETEIIAIKGLLLQAREDGDIKKAIFLAEKAANLAKNADWPIAILLDLYKHSAQWDKLESTIDKALSKKVISRSDALKMLAVCVLAQASVKEQSGETERALGMALSALKILPDFVPALVQIARLNLLENHPKQAIKLIEKHWARVHHPSLLALYLEAMEGESHEKSLQKAEKLIEKTIPSPENYTTLARFAIRTGQLAKANHFLEQSLSLHETQEAALLQAELLRREGADSDKVMDAENRALNAESGAAWHCHSCGHTTKAWDATCPHCHAFGSLEWGSSKAVASNPVATGLIAS